MKLKLSVNFKRKLQKTFITVIFEVNLMEEMNRNNFNLI